LRTVLLRISGALILVLGSMVAPAQVPAGAKFDGPAELPRLYMNSKLSDTPSPGESLLVKNAEELQSALESVRCGETIRLQAGAEFAGDFKFAARECDEARWITIRTSAKDSDLPAEGNRITPCFAGVASLPGRPEYPCSSPKNVMARLIFTGKSGQPMTIQEGANHYRFLGLEITREANGAVIYNLVSMKAKADHLVFDRDWIHGTAQDETTRGIALGRSTYVAVVDSYFTDFHCVAVTGACLDAQAISGGLGDDPMGPYKIVNNFLEASGENIMFGGGPATLNPADIEIRRNHLFKPLTWRPGSPGFVGGLSGRPFIVKNLFELKNAQRVLFEGNILENCWSGFSQAGFAILITPKNQSNRCPNCRTTDITIRFDRVSHIASGLVMGTGLSDAGGAASGGARYSIHDVIFDDLDGKAYGGFGALFQVTSDQPALRDVSISHITGFASRALFIMGVNLDHEKIINFNFTNNLVGVGSDDIVSTGGGMKNCAFQPRVHGPEEILKTCFASFNFASDAFIGSAGRWPKGNLQPGSPSDVYMVDFHEGKGGDYHLCHEKKGDHCKKKSPAAGAGSDGKDLGADVDAVRAATEGVE
jgi:hypothetical protein